MTALAFLFAVALAAGGGDAGLYPDAENTPGSGAATGDIDLFPHALTVDEDLDSRVDGCAVDDKFCVELGGGVDLELSTTRLLLSQAQINFGGDTSSYVAIRRAGTAFEVILADASAYATVNTGSLRLSTGSKLNWQSSTQATAPFDGDLLLSDAAGTDFGILYFGGTTSSFPALKRSSDILQVRLGDDSDFGRIQAGDALFGDTRINASSRIYWNNRSSITSPANGNLTLSNNTLSDFGILQFGGTTVSFPALKRNGANLEVRLADDSGRANIFAADVQVNASRFLFWNSGTKLLGTPNGNLVMTNNAGTDFSTLQFGGSTSSFPGFKRLGGSLQLVRADGSSFTNLTLNKVISSTATGATTEISPPGQAVLTCDGGASLTTSGLISDGDILDGVTTWISTGLTGPTSMEVGDGTDQDLFGVQSVLVATSTTDNSDATAQWLNPMLSSAEVTITFVGGNCTAGEVKVVAHKRLITPPTS